MRLVLAEQCLFDLKQLKGLSTNHRQRYFQTRSSPARIEDDHIPFLIRGVRLFKLAIFRFEFETFFQEYQFYI